MAVNIIPAEHAHPNLTPPKKCVGSGQVAEVACWYGVWHGVCSECGTPWILVEGRWIPVHNKL